MTPRDTVRNGRAGKPDELIAPLGVKLACESLDRIRQHRAGGYRNSCNDDCDEEFHCADPGASCDAQHAAANGFEIRSDLCQPYRLLEASSQN